MQVVIDMKDNSKIIHSMVMVHLGSILILILCNSSLCIQKIGKLIYKNGDQYEGEFKDNALNGYGILR